MTALIFVFNQKEVKNAPRDAVCLKEPFKCCSGGLTHINTFRLSKSVNVFQQWVYKKIIRGPHWSNPDSNPPGGWVVLAAAGEYDGLVVIETAKSEFLPDGLSLVPLGLQEPDKNTRYVKDSNVRDSAEAISVWPTKHTDWRNWKITRICDEQENANGSAFKRRYAWADG